MRTRSAGSGPVSRDWAGAPRSSTGVMAGFAMALALLLLVPAQGIRAQVEVPEAVTSLSVTQLVALYEAALDAYLRYGHPEGLGLSAASESPWDLSPAHWGMQVTSPVNLSREINEALGIISEKWEIPLRAERDPRRARLGVSIPFVSEEGHFRVHLTIGHIQLSPVIVERNEVGEFQGFWAPQRYTPPLPGR